MKTSYKILGLSCNGCRNHVENILSNINGIKSVIVHLENAEAIIESNTLLPIEILQEAFLNDGGNYSIIPAHLFDKDVKKTQVVKNDVGRNGVYYCPMHCEGDKTYAKNVGCPICGMDLIEAVSTEINNNTAYKELLKKFTISIIFIEKWFWPKHNLKLSMTKLHY